MNWLSDKVLAHLRRVADEPDLSGTNYELVEKIGQGGMGSVYLVRDPDLDREVALKVLDAPPSDVSMRNRMLQEARIIARLEHPGIVPVHDVGVLPDGRVYYAMKRVRGQRLDEPSDASLAERLRSFEKICQAVAFAHAHGVLHRDLKPQNIMVGAFGEVLVMDWGLAKLRNGAATETALVLSAGEAADRASSAVPITDHGAVMGTPGYMAPEQARGEVGLLDERTDVFALGGILHFLLSGGPPSGEMQRRLPRFVPRPLAAVCQKALAAEPNDRYVNVTELAAEVGRFLAGERVAAYPESIFGATLRLLSKYRVAVLLLFAYLVMRILLLIFTRT